MKKTYYRYWGKAQVDNDRYHLLLYHCLDVAAVGAVLLKRHHQWRSKLASILALPEEVFCSLMILFLSLHDLGKFSEAFQGVRSDLYRRLSGKKAEKDYLKRHDTLGYVAWKTLWKKWKKEGMLGLPHGSVVMSSSAFDQWIQAVTGHHGKPPEFRGVYVEDYFNEFDLEAVEDFVKETGRLFMPESDKYETYFEGKQLAEDLKSASWWIAGFSVLCDWIGSDSSYFGYQDAQLPIEDYWKHQALPNADRAVAASGILPADKMKYSSIQNFFEYIENATPLQSFCHAREIISEPQLWILEDVTGSGKTEAALALAHRLINAGEGEGIFIALPTMATSNAMYERMAGCYRKIYADQSTPSLILAHSARHLSKKFHQSILSEHVRDLNYVKSEQSASAACNAWLADHKKKALLADVGVGTVDQALFGILPVRHQSLRLLGILGKVLIIDEIHAYDGYTGRLIQVLLTFHAHMGGSAILLSATLPQQMRQALAQAFRNGLGVEEDIEAKDNLYPLITEVTSKGFEETHIATRKTVEREVKIQLLHDEEAVYALILKAAQEGRCVCWIRNTVPDAVSSYLYLKESHRLSDENLMLFHSRFALADRIGIEEKVITYFGERSGATDRADRILIATQVVEQSLDLDFDIIVSDLAPMDLIIQRAGRLHRHIRDNEGNRNGDKDAVDKRPEPILYVYGPEPVAVPGEKWYQTFFPKGCHVYPHVGRLWRTARLLLKLGCIRMPQDARVLIEGVYGEDRAEPIPEELQEASWMAEGEEKGRRDIGNFNTLKIYQGYSHSNETWDEDHRFPTRLGQDTITVYLARYEDGELRPWADGNYPWDLSSLRVSSDMLSDVSSDISADLKKKLKLLKETEKVLNSYVLVMPMFRCGEDEWRGNAKGRKGKSVTVRYSSRMGFMIEE